MTKIPPGVRGVRLAGWFLCGGGDEDDDGDDDDDEDDDDHKRGYDDDTELAKQTCVVTNSITQRSLCACADRVPVAGK